MSGFQAAIWQVEYGSSFVFESSNSAVMTSAYNNYLAAVNTATIDPSVVSQVLWLNPGGHGEFQGLVTLATPEPASIGLAAIAVVALGGYYSRRRRRCG
jgi:hypothetical protein